MTQNWIYLGEQAPRSRAGLRWSEEVFRGCQFAPADGWLLRAPVSTLTRPLALSLSAGNGVPLLQRQGPSNPSSLQF